MVVAPKVAVEEEDARKNAMKRHLKAKIAPHAMVPTAAVQLAALVPLAGQTVKAAAIQLLRLEVA